MEPRDYSRGSPLWLQLYMHTIPYTVRLLYLGMDPLEPLFSWRFGQYAIYGDLGSKVKGRTVPYGVRYGIMPYLGGALCHIWGFYPKWPRTPLWYATVHYNYTPIEPLVTTCPNLTDLVPHNCVKQSVWFC